MSNEIIPAQKTELVPEEAHHKHGPSKLPYYAACPVFFNKNREVNDAAEEGDQLHACMQQIAETVAASGLKRSFQSVLQTLFEEWSIDATQLGYLQYACAQIDDLIEAFHPVDLAAEEKVTLYRGDGSPIHWGTLDLCLFVPDRKMIIVIDYKFGWIPVTPAPKNMQGRSYGCAALQEVAPDGYRNCAVVFIQPKLETVTHHTYTYAEIPVLVHQIDKLIERATEANKDPDKVIEHMNAGSHCAFCEHVGKCTVHARMMAEMAPKHLPAKVDPKVLFNTAMIKTPEQLVLARYMVDLFEDAFKPIKDLMNQHIATEGDNKTYATLPDGTVLHYKKFSRAMDRTLGDTVEVSKALSEFVSWDQLIACAKLSLTKLLPVATKAYQEQQKAQGRDKFTLKQAKKEIEDLLTTLGLLSQPEGRIEYAKLVKTQHQLEQNTN